MNKQTKFQKTIINNLIEKRNEWKEKLEEEKEVNKK